MPRVKPAESRRSWLLDHRTGWRTDPATASGAGVAVGERITLAAIAGGPLSLASADGSLGGLVLPRGVAVDDHHRVYLLSAAGPTIRRFDHETGRFEILDTIGGYGRDPRRLREPGGIAVGRSQLYVADTGNRRLQVFDTDSLALLWLGAPSDGWEPVDVVTGAGTVFVLDALGRRVYTLDLIGGHLEPAVRIPAGDGVPSRIAIDRDGAIHVLLRGVEPESARLVRFDGGGRQAAAAYDPESVRERFEAPAVAFDHRGRFTLAGPLGRVCVGHPVENPCEPNSASGATPADRTAPAEQTALATAATGGAQRYDREGAPIAVERYEAAGPRPYRRNGTWISKALDSGIHGCQWHRLALTLDSLPEETTIRIWTNVTDRETAANESAPPMSDPFWVGYPEFVGGTRPADQARLAGDRELAVRSGKGRFLWLRIELVGDGYDTPALSSVRLHFPRGSYLDFLPAVYSADDESRGFLERFLSVLQTEWDDFDEKVATFARYLDPNAVPDGDFVTYLAEWLAMPLEASWTWDQKRRLLAAAPALYPLRGTLEGLRRFLRTYLQNIADLPDDASTFPQIVEGFRERDRLILGDTDRRDLGNAAPLWGPSFVGRLQLDVFAREGDVRLVSTGAPERDLFDEYAHRFRVYVPSSWIGGAEDERMLRRAIETDKPAHTQYDLCLVAPRFRIGVQSTVGVDSVIAGYPVAHLRCDQHDDAPSRPVSARLGYDTVLAAAAAPAIGLQLAPASRVGIAAGLT